MDKMRLLHWTLPFLLSNPAVLHYQSIQATLDQSHKVAVVAVDLTQGDQVLVLASERQETGSPRRTSAPPYQHLEETLQLMDETPDVLGNDGWHSETGFLLMMFCGRMIFGETRHVLQEG